MQISHGMDVGAVRQLASQFGAKADEIDQIASTLTTQLDGTAWIGPDATRFRSDWQSQHVAALRNVSNALREAQQTAMRNADQQEQASSN